MNRKKKLFLGIAAAAIAVLVVGFLIKPRNVIEKDPSADSGIGTQEKLTHLYKLKYSILTIPPFTKDQGHTSLYTSVARVKDQMLWVDGKGNFSIIGPDLRVTNTRAAVDTNGEEFEKFAAGALDTRRFAVKDIEFHEGRSELFVSYNFWNASDECYTLRVSKASIALPLDEAFSPRWEPIYETSPCIPFAELTHVGQMMESGGRLAVSSDDILLLTTGDNMFDGLSAVRLSDQTAVVKPNYAQDPSVEYGKTIAIDLTTNKHRLFTIGHRNPQGIAIGAGGTIYQTEHGPKGGDELNVLEEHGNYGWPLESFGTEYDSFEWPLATTTGEHRQHVMPLYSWVPSVGISDLEVPAEEVFSSWKDDVLVGSLTHKTMYRVRIRKGKVRYVEPIDIGYPIREIIEMSDGRLLISTTNTTVVVVEPV